jgi:phospholipase C
MTDPDPIERVVLLMLENHSFDQMLGAMKSVYPTLDGIDPNAPNTNDGPGASKTSQQPVALVQVTPDPKHEAAHVRAQLANGGDGFVRDYVEAFGADGVASADQVMAYFPKGALPALHALAADFTVCDRWFASVPGPTWPNRFFALSGSSNGLIEMPESIAHLKMLTGETQPTLFDRLNEAKKTWSVYFYDFPVSLILRQQQRPENLCNYHLVDELFDAAARGDDHRLPEFVLIEPRYFGIDQNDDHPPHNVMKAQKLVADVYNAIRSNPALWKSTLLVVLYDEHGGFYDHVPPPEATPPEAQAGDEWTFDRLGVRVPAVLVSPWLDRGVVSTTFDHTSLLKYLQDKWSLGSLGARTAAASSIACAFKRTTMREGGDSVAFIRIPHRLLIAPDPELEKRDVSTHHNALHIVADMLEGGAAVGVSIGVEELARAADAYEHGWKRWLALVGDFFVRLGSGLRAPLERAQKARFDRTYGAVTRLIESARSQARR